MRVVIVGLGRVGSYLAKILSAEEKYDVVGIDIGKQRVDVVSDLYDIQTVEGYGSAPHVLKQAEAHNADIFIAVTNSDELNIVAALIAKKLGAAFTIVRVSDPVYLEQQQLEDYQTLGIDLLISPERRTALTLYQTIEYPHFLKVDTLGDGKVHINQYRVSSKNPFANKKIKDLYLTTEMLIVGITRKRDFLFPTGDTIILPNDILFIVAKEETMQNIEPFLPIESKEIRRIILLGATKISYFFAKLAEQKYRVMIIEPESETSDQFAQMLDNTLIYNDNIFTSNFLDEILLNEHDYFIAATESDEVNLLSSILLKDKGLLMIACIIHQSYLLSTIEKTGIYQVFSPQMIISNEIISTIRARALLTLPNIENIAAEFVEIEVQPNSVVNNQEIRQLALPAQTLFVAVMRDNDVFIPRGHSVLQTSDRVIVLCLKSNFETIKTLFSSP